MFITEKMIALIAPHHCLVCDTEGSLLCNWCEPDFLDPLPSRCYSCHKLRPDFAVCTPCRKKSPLSQVWIATSYTENAKQLLEQLKFNRCKAAAPVIAEYLNETLPLLEKDIIIAHVPTATSRRRQRGYDQSELIARELAKRRGLRLATLLARTGHTRQVGATKKQRAEQMQQAFRAANQQDLSGATVLLIDDLTTTGATLEAASKVLKTAGAKKIFAATFAQKT